MATQERDGPNLAFGDFVIDRGDERVLGPDGPVRLGQKAYRVLLALAEQQGRLLTKDALFETVWDGTIVGESALTSAIKELRRALGDESRTPRYVESVYGRGYRLIAPVRMLDGVTPAPRAGARPAPAAAEPAAGEGRPPVVLVSAFQDDAVRARHPNCAEQLREEVLAGLSRFREIQLIADDRPEGACDASRRGERCYQLTAILLPDGDGVKVIARAKRASDGRILWAETMSLAATGTAGGVETIVRRIAAAALPAVDEDLFLGLPHDGADLYDRYLIAKRRSLTPASYDEAKATADELEAIIAERPDFALAYPPLVRLYNIDFGYTRFGATGPAERARALALAKAGLAADRGNVHAYTVLGFCHLWHKQRGPARTFLEQALALNPYNPARLNEVAAGMIQLGDFARARELLEMSRALQPFDGDELHEDLGRLLLFEGDCEAARPLLESVNAGSIWAELYLALSELRLGMAAEGEGRLARWRERVARDWHSGRAPSDGELTAWISFHHPLLAEAGLDFFDQAAAALRAAPGPQPTGPAPG